MKRMFLTGTQAAAMGARHAGIDFAIGRPERAQTAAEVLHRLHTDPAGMRVCCVTEAEAALQQGAGAACAGARVLVSVTAEELYNEAATLLALAHSGVRGALVILVADDPGMTVSATAPDTRHLAKLVCTPVFDPSSAAEAYPMMKDAFMLSEELSAPVLYRLTPDVGAMREEVATTNEPPARRRPIGFSEDPDRWIASPRQGRLSRLNLEQRRYVLQEKFSVRRCNRLEAPLSETDDVPAPKKGILTGGGTYIRVQKTLQQLGLSDAVKVLKLATAHPFPQRLTGQFLSGLDEVLVAEDGDPVLESALLQLCGRHVCPMRVHGRLDGTLPPTGLLTAAVLTEGIAALCELDKPAPTPSTTEPERSELPENEPLTAALTSLRTSAEGSSSSKRLVCVCEPTAALAHTDGRPPALPDMVTGRGMAVNMALGLAAADPTILPAVWLDVDGVQASLSAIEGAVRTGSDLLLVLEDAHDCLMAPIPTVDWSVNALGNVPAEVVHAVHEQGGVRAIRLTIQ